ncbi:2-hydroxyacid dehydrogenase [Solwaraspora sp. WMMB762]|uniref:2-hydroxyacid dehydrogenase n=1 Tax=Solwaraspora sp. WMMB762 TaxID=3404120 RepID=UPI003B94B8A1
MRVAVFSTKPYDKRFLAAANAEAGHDLVFLEPRLSAETAPLAAGCDAVCAFVNDDLSAPVLETLAGGGVRLVALRSAGFNHVDLATARRLGLTVTRVPGYSPHAVAEHCAGLILALNRKIHRAYNRVREHNFALSGLLGFDLHGRTVGVVGTGKIGVRFIRIMAGFGCRVLAADPYPSDEAVAAGASYVPLPTLLAESDIVTLHCPLTPDTHHLIDEERIAQMRDGVMLINTSRGALVDTAAVIRGLKSGKIGYLGLDVYEEEADLFFEDLSDQMLRDDLFSRLVTFPNVLITGHQAFFTEEALHNIATTTVGSLTAYEREGTPADIQPDALVH